MKRLFWLAMLAIGLPPIGSASAHHSFAMFDRAQVATLTGTVKELQWSAPHVLLWVVKDPKDGQADGTLWTIEMSTGPGPLSRVGWTKRSLVPGDRVTVEFNPLRSGDPGGSFKRLTILKTGAVLATGAPPADMDDLAEPPAAAPPATQ
ncbi:MAG: hypothetical protein HYR63_28935 [Proteobacteria bacterium]|nr:hypothetical protein [Pseudomonadota bacterium]